MKIKSQFKFIALIICISCVCFANNQAIAQSAGQGITFISGFHAAAESDPFADKNEMLITSNKIQVNGLRGVYVSLTLDGSQELLTCEIDITGVQFDLTQPVYSGYGVYTRYLDYKLRIDSKQAQGGRMQASDFHHFLFPLTTFSGAPFFSGNTALIGFSAGGNNIALKIDFRQPIVANFIKAFNTKKQKEADKVLKEENVRAEKKAEKKKADSLAQINLTKSINDYSERGKEFVDYFEHYLGPVPAAASFKDDAVDRNNKTYTLTSIIFLKTKSNDVPCYWVNMANASLIKSWVLKPAGIRCSIQVQNLQHMQIAGKECVKVQFLHSDEKYFGEGSFEKDGQSPFLFVPVDSLVYGERY